MGIFRKNNKLNNQQKNTIQSNQLNQSNQSSIKIKSSKDTYSILDYPTKNKLYGEFTGSSPKRAAQKAFSKLAKLSNIKTNSNDFIVFTIVNKRTNKLYKYLGKRNKLTEPKVIYRNGKKVEYKFVNTVGKYKEELNQIK